MNEDIVAALNAERYGPSLWWKAPRRNQRVIEVPQYDNSEAACARRLRDLAADFDAGTTTTEEVA